MTTVDDSAMAQLQLPNATTSDPHSPLNCPLVDGSDGSASQRRLRARVLCEDVDNPFASPPTQTENLCERRLAKEPRQHKARTLGAVQCERPASTSTKHCVFVHGMYVEARDMYPGGYGAQDSFPE